MNVERMKLLVTLLRELKTRDDFLFSLAEWVTDASDLHHLTLESANRRVWDDHPCGTVHCAVGAAGVDPRFNALGFELALNNHDAMTPHYEGLENWDAVAMFFGIDYDEATYLFQACEYPNGDETTIDEVIDRLEETIAAGEFADEDS